MICMHLEVLEARGLARPRAAQLGLLCVLDNMDKYMRENIGRKIHASQ